MNFLQLLDGAEILAQSGNPSVSGLEYDSRRVKSGDAFIAMRGEASDGNKFIDKAIAAGAVAVVSDSASETPREGVAWAQVQHGRRALARLSANFWKRPAERLALTGITGTNGKSTTAFLLEAILRAANRKSALIGTICNGGSRRLSPSAWARNSVEPASTAKAPFMLLWPIRYDFSAASSSDVLAPVVTECNV